MSHEDYVSFEQAKALKELGFAWESTYFYDLEKPQEDKIKSKIPQDFNIMALVSLSSAPTLSQAQKWLREVKGIDITAVPSQHYGVKKYRWMLNRWSPERHGWDENLYDTYEQALSAGIDKALQHLKYENNGE